MPASAHCDGSGFGSGLNSNRPKTDRGCLSGKPDAPCCIVRSSFLSAKHRNCHVFSSCALQQMHMWFAAIRVLIGAAGCYVKANKNSFETRIMIMALSLKTMDHAVVSNTDRLALLGSFWSLLHFVADFFSDFRKAVCVSSDFKALSKLSDETLQARGFSQDQLAKQIYQRHGL